MEAKLFESELKVMELLWERAPQSAKELSLLLERKVGWNKNTSYTVIKKLEAKGYLRREEPGFVCTPLISREEVRRAETGNLIERLFGGSKKALFSALLEDETLSEEEIAELRAMIGRKG